MIDKNVYFLSIRYGITGCLKKIRNCAFLLALIFNFIGSTADNKKRASFKNVLVNLLSEWNRLAFQIELNFISDFSKCEFRWEHFAAGPRPRVIIRLWVLIYFYKVCWYSIIFSNFGDKIHFASNWGQLWFSNFFQFFALKLKRHYWL